MLRRCAESGLSVAEFSEQYGLSRNRLGTWRRRLAEQDADTSKTSLQVASPAPLPVSAPTGFVEVTRPIAADPFAVQTRSGRTVIVPSSFDASALRNLLAVVEEVETC